MGRRCRCTGKIGPCRRIDQATGLSVPAAQNAYWAQRKHETKEAKCSSRKDNGSNNRFKATSCVRASWFVIDEKKKLERSEKHWSCYDEHVYIISFYIPVEDVPLMMVLTQKCLCLL